MNETNFFCLKIGPGSYQSRVGIFEKTATLSGMSSKDKFFTIDNGHVNIRPQQYSTIKKNITQIQMNKEEIDRPGPGSYNTFDPLPLTKGMTRNASPVNKGGTSVGAIINPITVVQAVSPGRAAAATRIPHAPKPQGFHSTKV